MNVTQLEIIAIIKATGVSANIEQIDGATSLKKSGIDSLEMMNVLLGMEEKYGIHIPDEDVAALVSVDAIVDYLRKL